MWAGMVQRVGLVGVGGGGHQEVPVAALPPQRNLAGDGNPEL